jgi:hypothetical protein
MYKRKHLRGSVVITLPVIRWRLGLLRWTATTLAASANGFSSPSSTAGGVVGVSVAGRGRNPRQILMVVSLGKGLQWVWLVRRRRETVPTLAFAVQDVGHSHPSHRGRERDDAGGLLVDMAFTMPLPSRVIIRSGGASLASALAAPKTEGTHGAAKSRSVPLNGAQRFVLPRSSRPTQPVLKP